MRHTREKALLAGDGWLNAGRKEPWLERLLFPRGSGCLVCGDPRRADEKYQLCPECREALLRLRLREQVCPRCMTPLNEKGKCGFCAAGRMQGLHAAYAAYRHQGAARSLVTLLKFEFQDDAAAALASGMAQSFPAYEYDALTPVPLHPTRRRERGGNQAEILCRAVGERVGLPVLDVLARTRATRMQTRLDAARRQHNVRGAFAVTGQVEGLRLLVVDDVRTTGATSRACAGALMAAGARYVGVLTATAALRGGEE